MRSDSRRFGHGGRSRARRLPLATLVAGVCAAAFPGAPAAAQESFLVAGHVGRSAAAPSGMMVGLAGEARALPWAVRLGAGIDAAGTAMTPFAPAASGVWATDVDAAVYLEGVPYLRNLVGKAHPALFLGAGVAGFTGANPDAASETTALVATWSYGARVGVPFSRWLGFEVEARQRDAFGEVAREQDPVRAGWEYRAGVALSFGGTPSPELHAVVVPAPQRSALAASEPLVTPSREVPEAIEPISTEEPVDVAAEIAARAILTADGFVGTPYRWGGDSPSEGFDCSGFVQHVFGEQGIRLPRVSRDQARSGTALPTSLENLAPGDLLFFAQRGPNIDHVAIYAGEGRIVHASRSGYGVRYDELTGDRGRWYAQHLVAVRRIITGNEALPDERPALASGGADEGTSSEEMLEALAAERGDDAPPPQR